MQRKIGTLLALTLFGASLAFAAPAAAEQTLLSKIIFGKVYDDGVTAIRITVYTKHDGAIPLAIAYAGRDDMSKAQSAVRSDPRLMRAIAARGIALHNVVGLETAMNGGHILYYR
ncbi:hypothetical protein [Rhizobium binxianense]